MMALLTVTVCLAGATQACEVRETTVDAVLCFTGSRNAAKEQVPEGYTLASLRCVPQTWWLAPEHRPRSGRDGPLAGADGQGPG